MALKYKDWILPKPTFNLKIYMKIKNPYLSNIFCFFLVFGLPQITYADDFSFFESKIRPILIEHCYECHAEEKKIRGGLLVDSKIGLLKGGDSGPSIIPGNPDKSLFIKAVSHEGDLKMPPKGKLKPEDIKNLKEWVAKGALDPRENQSKTISSINWEKSREFWSFLPIKEIKIETSKTGKNPIDILVLNHLKTKGLTFSGPAAPNELLRRLSFSLTGLPPSIEDTEEFNRDYSPEAYGKMVDKYLSSKAYAERWARHWLDVARYAEDQAHTFGVKPNSDAFKYRDWVIKAFDNDMPFTKFIRYQISADLIAEPERTENLAALGFFGLGAQYYKNTDAARAIADELDDRIDTLSRGFLGLTVSCARCHDHKYDPIPTQDYYSIAGVFHSSKLNNTPLCTIEEVKAYETAKQKLADSENKLNYFIHIERAPFVEKRVLDFEKYFKLTFEFIEKKNRDPKVSFKDYGEDKVIVEKWFKFIEKNKSNKKYSFFMDPWNEIKDKSSEEQKLTAANKAKNGLLKILSSERSATNKEKPNKNSEIFTAFFEGEGLLPLGDSWKKELVKQKADELKNLEDNYNQLKKVTPESLPVVNAIAESTPSDLKIYIRGNPAKQGELAPRRFLKILAGDDRKNFTKGSGRTELADAITSPDNPLTSRVISNRVWAWHFGKGIVPTPSNFGKLGDPPSNPELLDFLAKYLIDSGWSIKSLHKLILCSETFKQSSQDNSVNLTIDPQNTYLWKFNRQRLDVESWRDSILFVSGTLDKTVGGPTFNLNDDNAKRRTIYAKISRHELNSLLRIFDFPDPNITSEKRIETTVPQQQLFIINSPFVIEQSKALAKRIQNFSKSDSENINHCYQLLFSRKASPDELKLALLFLQSKNDGTQKSFDKMDRWEMLAQAFLASNEFMYID
jgi:Protein of unknown function (DUF1553)/Protein of unknown function (DUF1549)/Planctomycete cytochrome C